MDRENTKDECESNKRTKLIALTQSQIVSDGKRLSPEEHIVYCARVSNPNNQLNTETSSGLLKYCIKHGHWSIFEQIDLTVEIKTSRAIAAQILRHKSASFQEFSQRYSTVQSFEDIELRQQGATNRQVGDVVFDPIVGELWQMPASELCSIVTDRCREAYEKLIEAGVAKECARMILPLSTQTTMYMKNNIRNWIHYIELRTKEDTQKEHRIIAEEIKDIFTEQFPNVSESLEWT